MMYMCVHVPGVLKGCTRMVRRSDGYREQLLEVSSLFYGRIKGLSARHSVPFDLLSDSVLIFFVILLLQSVMSRELTASYCILGAVIHCFPVIHCGLSCCCLLCSLCRFFFFFF